MFKPGDKVTFIKKSHGSFWNYYDLKIGKDYIITSAEYGPFDRIKLLGYDDIQDPIDFDYNFNKKLMDIIDEI